MVSKSKQLIAQLISDALLYARLSWFRRRDLRRLPRPGGWHGFLRVLAGQLIAAIEREIGPEAAEATRRSLRLASNPRALTDAERAELRASLEPVLQDMRSSDAIVPDIREEAHDELGPDCVCAWIHSPGGVGSQGIRVQVSLFAPERLADLADQLQEWEIEELAAAGRPATWPECPQHPGTHPLAPQARSGQAVWCCPASGQAISVIGALRSH